MSKLISIFQNNDKAFRIYLTLTMLAAILSVVINPDELAAFSQFRFIMWLTAFFALIAFARVFFSTRTLEIFMQGGAYAIIYAIMGAILLFTPNLIIAAAIGLFLACCLIVIAFRRDKVGHALIGLIPFLLGLFYVFLITT